MAVTLRSKAIGQSITTADCRLPALLLLAIFSLLLPATAASMPGQSETGEQTRTVIPYRDGIVTLISDYQGSITKTQYRVRGHVQISFKDILVTGDEAVYDSETRKGNIAGKVRFSQKDQWLTCSRAEFDFASQTGAFYDATGRTDREFWISSRTIIKTGPDTYRLEDPLVTTCQQKLPKWTFQASRANIRVDRTARLHSTVFKIKGVPVFYFPYLIVPLEKKERSSGFIPFHTGNSTSKGRVFSEGYYQTLGESADATISGDYFSLRGLAIRGVFRARPNPETKFYLEAYGIRDKLNQGGVQLIVDGVTQLKDDWRAVAKVNITSNFSFRQAFAESFHSATVSQERATAFLTRNHNSISTNIAFDREEVVFPIHNLVVRKVPSLEINSLGTPLGHSPLIFSFRTSFDGLSRTDSTMQTQGLIQRLDFYPRMTLRLPSIKGFSLVPSFGLRETYYGAQLSDNSESGVVNNGLHRRYADLSIELKTPVLERDFSSSWFGKMQHTIEPFVTYRWTQGIDEFNKIIRFDEQDAIANTNELEYGIVNRFFRTRRTNSDTQQNQEFMSLALVQKYYFDPTFGGAFRPNQPNAFYPLDTVTGFYQTGMLGNLAPVSAIFQLSPQNGIHNDFRVDFDTRLQRWRDESFSTYWHQGKFVVSGIYVKAQALQPGMLASNHIQGQIGYGLPQRGFSSSLTVSYNLKTGQWLNSNTKMNYNWDCCGLALEFTQFDLGLRTESRFSFSFTLKGIGSFGNLKRPESLF
jgi:LPS-assembly protein